MPPLRYLLPALLLCHSAIHASYPKRELITEQEFIAKLNSNPLPYELSYWIIPEDLPKDWEEKWDIGWHIKTLIKEGRLDLLKVLIERADMSIDHEDEVLHHKTTGIVKATLLYHAIIYNQNKIIDYLLAKGARMDPVATYTSDNPGFIYGRSDNALKVAATCYLYDTQDPQILKTFMKYKPLKIKDNYFITDITTTMPAQPPVKKKTGASALFSHQADPIIPCKKCQGCPTCTQNPNLICSTCQKCKLCIHTTYFSGLPLPEALDTPEWKKQDCMKSPRTGVAIVIHSFPYAIDPNKPASHSIASAPLALYRRALDYIVAAGCFTIQKGKTHVPYTLAEHKKEIAEKKKLLSHPFGYCLPNELIELIFGYLPTLHNLSQYHYHSHLSTSQKPLSLEWQGPPKEATA